MRTLSVVCLAMVMLPAICPAEPLTKEQLLEMADSGVGDSVILSFIERDCLDFDVTPMVAIELSKVLSEQLVEAVLKCGDDPRETDSIQNEDRPNSEGQDPFEFFFGVKSESTGQEPGREISRARASGEGGIPVEVGRAVERLKEIVWGTTKCAMGERWRAKGRIGKGKPWSYEKRHSATYRNFTTEGGKVSWEAKQTSFSETASVTPLSFTRKSRPYPEDGFQWKYDHKWTIPLAGISEIKMGPYVVWNEASDIFDHEKVESDECWWVTIETRGKEVVANGTMTGRRAVSSRYWRDLPDLDDKFKRLDSAFLLFESERDAESVARSLEALAAWAKEGNSIPSF